MNDTKPIEWAFHTGGPDDIPDLTVGDGAGQTCDAIGPEGYICTRRPEHTGRHAAGAFEVIVEVWS